MVLKRINPHPIKCPKCGEELFLTEEQFNSIGKNEPVTRMFECCYCDKLFEGREIMPEENLGPSTVAPPNNISDKDKAKLEAKVKREKAKKEKKEKKHKDKPKPPTVKSNIDLGPIECVCPNCRQKHEITYSPNGETLIVKRENKRLSTGTGNRFYRCPCCHLNLPMRKPVVKKENEDEKTDPC